MKKIDLVQLVEDVNREEIIEGGVHKVFALTCLHRLIEMQEEPINFTEQLVLEVEKMNGNSR